VAMARMVRGNEREAVPSAGNGRAASSARQGQEGLPMTRTIGIVGVPSSAGAYAPGQELAPGALRSAGLADRLRAYGAAVVDHGDSPIWRWRPDRARPRAQNLAAVVDQATTTANRVREVLAQGQLALVLGGDCTVELGTVAGHLQLGAPDDVGLIYVDLHADLNTPESVVDGALDWMGMAHLLGEEHATPELSRFGPRFPLLAPEQVLLFAVDPDQGTGWEREVIARRGLTTITAERVARNPEHAAAEALAWFGPERERLLLHFDVDVIDFTAAPLSENTGRNLGLSFETALRAFAALAASDRLSAVTVTELNPLHGAEDGSTVALFADRLAAALAP
jgi:arginase